MNSHSLRPLLLTFVIAQISFAQSPIQLSPSAASTQLYFAQLADGGPAGQNWAVTLILNNPGLSSVTTTTNFFSDQGQPLPIDFGNGPSSTLSVNLSAGGTATVTSLGNSTQTNVGWALTTSNYPITGTILYRATVNGTPTWDVAAAGTGPTYLYSSFATPSLGIALVNPSATQSINVLVTAKDSQGNIAGGVPLNLGPSGHTSFNLNLKISSLPGNFTGSITVSSIDSPPTAFVAWALNSRGNLLSPLPPGEMLSPVPQSRVAADVAALVLPEVLTMVESVNPASFNKLPSSVYQGFTATKVQVDSSPTISAMFSNGTLRVSTAMLQALAGSRPAIAFMVMQAVFAGLLAENPPKNVSGVADLVDAMSAFIPAMVGLDPYSAADFLYRLRNAQIQGVPIDPTLANYYGLPNSYESRLTSILTAEQGLCSMIFPSACPQVHALWHPDLTAQVP